MLFTYKRSRPSPLRKPRPGSIIDRAHPLARGLVFYVPLLEGAGQPRDYVKGSRASAGGVWGKVPGGAGYRNYAELSCYRDVAAWPDDPTLNLTTSVTVCALCVRGTATNGVNANVIGKWNYVSESSNKGYGLFIHAPDTLPLSAMLWSVFNNNGVAVYQLASTETMASNQVAFLAGTWITTSAILYHQTYVQGTKSITTMAVPTAGVILGNNTSDLTNVIWAGIWNRVLTATEVAQLTYNPYSLLIRPPTRSRVDTSAAVGGSSILKSGILGSRTIS